MAQAYLEQRAAAGEQAFETLTMEAAREQSLRLSRLLGPGEAVAHVENYVIPGPHGGIPIRSYAPPGDGPFPILVFFHGGGWVMGSIETADVMCRALTNAVPCLVVSVNYRLAPEHKFPAAVEDAYAATCWISIEASSLTGDANRLAVGGVSAGGNLAAVIALLARDRGEPRIVYQLLSVPVTDYGFDTRSYQENAEGYVLTRNMAKWFWNHYLPTEADGAKPEASPLRALDMRGLPPAFVMTAEYDPLRDEGEAYARRLREAGVPVAHKRYEGMAHVFLGPEATADIGQHLRAAYGL
jgi:acetyl esterase